MAIISPLYVTLPRKGSAGKRVPLNLNWYRNAHYQTLNQAKVTYKKLIGPQIREITGISWPVKLSIKYYIKRRCDVGNIHSVLEKFFLDALVVMGRLPDDDINYVVGASYRFAGYDSKNPRAEIEILENCEL